MRGSKSAALPKGPRFHDNPGLNRMTPDLDAKYCHLLIKDKKEHRKLILLHNYNNNMKIFLIKILPYLRLMINRYSKHIYFMQQENSVRKYLC